MKAKEYLKEKGIDSRTIDSLNLVEILDGYANQSRWIDAEKEQPPINEYDKYDNDHSISIDVWCYHEDFGMLIGRYYYNAKLWTVTGYNSSHGIKVKFWQKLPEKP